MSRKGGGSRSGGGRTYVNNAMNRSLGRVGMPLGSAPVSRTSSSSSSYSGGGGSSRTYVDNSMNRKLGRVGMPLGSAPVSRTSSSSSSYSCGGGSSRTYVDNSMNRNLGRVGMVVGTAPVSRTSGSSSSNNSSSGRMSSRTYIDNSMNRSLGRVGMPLGSAPVSRTSKSSVSSNSNNSSSPKTYVDNSMNRRLGRVGMPLGSASVSTTSGTKSSKTKAQKCYVDNNFNRRNGRVGLPIGSMPISSNSRKTEIQNAYRLYEDYPDECIDAYNNFHHQQQGVLPTPDVTQAIQEMFERLRVWEQHRDFKNEIYTREDERQITNIEGNVQRNESRTKTPFVSYQGTVIQFQDLKIEEKDRIGHGGFGDIFAGKWQGKIVAIKKLRVQRVSKKRLKQFEEEVNVFCRLSHKNIITFYGACIKTPNICMVMELMSGSLYDKIHIEDFQFTNASKLFIAKEIACGLEYLHSQEVAHCDIKSTNILIDIFNQDNFCVKITDFGLSLMKNDVESSASTLVSGIGTPQYSAPEILRGDPLNINAMKMADVYSFGLVVHEIFSEEEPFEDLNIHQLRKQVGYGDTTPPLEIFRNDFDANLISLMKNCWSRKPTDRPTMRNAFLKLSTLSF